jgi:glycosyltransferase involved in cell wall biosynthesis
MAISSLGLAPYFPNRNFIGNMPNKPIEYMSAGLPILTCLEGLLGDTVQREKIGLIYRTGDPESLVAAVRAAQQDRARLSAMGTRAKSLFDESYRSEIVTEQYHQFIVRLAASRPQPAAAKPI